MILAKKVEHHSIDVHYTTEIDEFLLSSIYPDKSDDEISELLESIRTGGTTIDEIVEAALDANVDIEWDYDYEDMWTDRKGGYDVSFDIGD